MGWAFGQNNRGEEVGYGILDVCFEPLCAAKIDRGLAYCCGGLTSSAFGGTGPGCGQYFCGEHLYYVEYPPWHDPEVDGHPALCGACSERWEDLCRPSGATISEDGLYRYDLFRRWHHDGENILWIMLNPSTADASIDDPTIRRVVGFSKRWGYTTAWVVNLFALRATDPKELKRAADPVGMLNDYVIRDRIEKADAIVAAWGAHGDYKLRSMEIERIVNNMDRRLLCLGVTQAGHPRHPLYVRGDLQPSGLQEARAALPT